MPKKLDLTGQKYERLTAIKPCEKINNQTAWLCKCDCGNYKKVKTSSLRSGNTRSCGCLHKEIVNKNFSKDITNQRFGKLTALTPTNERKHGSIVWQCVCDCDNFKKVPAELLLSGHTQSCGCIRPRENAKIKCLLDQNNILYISEYPIRINNINYYYDFAILSNDGQIKCLIEYDGILHFEQDNYHGWNNKENWEKTKKNDIIKNNWAKENNILLIRIPYTDFEKIDFNYLKERMDNYE